MDFTSSFFEQEPEFMAVSTAEESGEGGGGWAAWAESASSSNSSNNDDDNDDMFDPFVLQGDNNKERRIENKQCISNNSTKMNSCLPVVLPGKHRKISYYSVSSGVSSCGGVDSKNNSSSSSSVGGAGAGDGPLGPWRVDLDDSALLTSHDDSIIISNTIKQQQTKQQQPTKQQQQVVSSHCLVDLDDTALIESDDLDDDDDEDENGNFNDSNDPAEKHGISSSSPTSSSSSPTTRTTTTSAVSPIDPWRFDVDRRYHDHDDGYSPHDDGYDCSTRSTSHNVGMMDQLLDSPDGPLFHDGSMDDVHHIGKSMSMSDNHYRHHPHHDCSSLDPWIEIVSTNDDSINGGGGTPFRASHSLEHHHHHLQQQQRPEALPEYDNEEDEEEGRDDSSGNNNDNNDYFGAPTSQKKMIDEDAIGTGRSSASPINTSYLSTIFPDVARNVTAAAAVCTTSAAASTPSTTATMLQQQHCPINEDSFGFAPFHALGGEDVGINDKEGEESFREANVFGLDDHPSSHDAAADGKGDHHHRHHHPKDGSYYSPPDNVDPYNSLAVYDEDDSTTDGFEESTAAHAVDHFHQDNDDEEDDDDAGDHAQNTTPPSFVKGRSKMAPSEEQQQQHDDDDDEDDEYKDSLDERENDEIVLVAQVEISDVEGAFEITATTSGEAVAAAAQDEDDDAVIEAADHIATAAASLVSVVDDPPLQVVESVDDDDTYQQDQDDDNDDDDEDSHHDDVKDGRLYRPNRSATSSADHGSFSGPASTSYSSNSLNTSGPSWAESTKSSGSSFTSIEQSKHWITLIVAHELWSDDCKVVEMAMGTLHRILLRSILHAAPQTNNNNNTNNKDNSHSLITESMSSHSGSASSQKRGKANAGSSRANTNKRNELIELAFCRGCPLAVIRAMKAHPTNKFLQDSGLCILNVFCWTGVATHVVEVGSLERAMAAIEQSKDMDTDEEKAVANRRNNNCNTKGAPEVVESAIYHIANLLRDKNLAARVLEAGGLEAIVNAMKRLSTQSDVQLAGCCAFRNLLQHHQRIVFGRQWANKVVQVGAIDRVIAALDDHPGNEKLQLEGYKILRRLSKLNEDRHGSRQGVDSHDDCHGEQVSECYFRTKNLDASDSFAPSFEI